MTGLFPVLVLSAAAVPTGNAAASPDPTSLDIPAAVRGRAAALVGELGDPRFAARERATRDLAALGRGALPALRDGLDQSADAEVRMRCELLLPRAEAADHAARVAVFVADRDAKFEHDLAGWGPFRTAVGDDPAARQLFAKIAAATPTRDVLIATRRPGRALQSLAADRWTRLYNESRPVQAEGVPPLPGRPLSVPEVAAVLLAEVVTPAEPDEGFGAGWIPTLLLTEESPVTEALRGRGPDRPAFLRLVAAWLDGKSGAVGVQHATQIATALQLPPAVAAKYHARLLDQKGQDAYAKVFAVGVLARSGDRGHLAVLERHRGDLDEVPVALPDGTAYGSRVADMALAAMIHLSGQKLTDYGYTIAPGGPVDFTRFDACRFAPDRTATVDQKRKRAAAKWDAWVKKNPAN